MCIGNRIIITLGGITAHIFVFIDFFNTVCIQSVFVIDNGMETDNIALCKLRRITFFDKDQIAGIECGRHGIGLNDHGRISRQAGYISIVSGCQRRKRE